MASVFVFKLNQDLADLFEDKHSQMRCLNTAILWKYPRWFPMSWTLTLYTIFGSLCYRIHLIVVRFFFTFEQYIIPIIHNAISILSNFSLHSEMKIQPEAQYFLCHALECKKVYSARFSIYKTDLLYLFIINAINRFEFS